ncbi:uncharacterized protein LY79DRAFT_656608 [Colletotrichum navitas]|uniref:Uncharacterized protein n=1 Tax=Colletotrichum navitas TaxID=681940 RepID=A0AAD8Q9E2_9PEZI|nr:uncharacterized protein LY79DRAFT_656608 [Colletotrichum navitas]KAK1597403.1 hypothetical protein LY79DRAFT_656608 [Colletotrichum navitas]
MNPGNSVPFFFCVFCCLFSCLQKKQFRVTCTECGDYLVVVPRQDDSEHKHKHNIPIELGNPLWTLRVHAEHPLEYHHPQAIMALPQSQKLESINLVTGSLEQH